MDHRIAHDIRGANSVLVEDLEYFGEHLSFWLQGLVEVWVRIIGTSYICCAAKGV